MLSLPKHDADAPLEIILPIPDLAEHGDGAGFLHAKAFADFAGVGPEKRIGLFFQPHGGGHGRLSLGPRRIHLIHARRKRSIARFKRQAKRPLLWVYSWPHHTLVASGKVISLDRLAHIMAGSPSNSRPQPMANKVSP